MTEPLADADIQWEDGVPVSRRFDDPYYARSDGLAESRHVFLDGNELAERFRGAGAFHIAELGFGTGLNFLAAVTLWRNVAPEGAVLTFSTFERFAMRKDEQARALAVWPELDGLVAEMLGGQLAGVDLNVIQGDVRETLPAWCDAADAWFLDGFAPARNPEMWGEALLAEIGARTRPGGTFATYTAAGHVRRSLQAAGFEVRKVPGFGSKRDMLVGRLPS